MTNYLGKKKGSRKGWRKSKKGGNKGRNQNDGPVTRYNSFDESRRYEIEEEINFIIIIVIIIII